MSNVKKGNLMIACILSLLLACSAFVLSAGVKASAAGEEPVDAPFFSENYSTFTAWGKPSDPDNNPATADSILVTSGDGMYFFKDGLYWHDTIGFNRYAGTDPYDMIFGFTKNVGKVVVECGVMGGAAGFDFAPNNYMFEVCSSATYDGTYTVKTALEATSKVEGEVITGDYKKVTFTFENFDPGMKFIKIVNKGAVNATLMLRGLDVYENIVVEVPVESVAIAADQTATMTAGSILTFGATRLPANASFNQFTYAVFDDEQALIPCTVGQFQEGTNRLSVDYAENETKTVYVVATCGGVNSAPFAVTVSPRPDASGISINAPSATTVYEGMKTRLSATVLPENANNKVAVWEVFDDEECTTVSVNATIDAATGVLTAGTLGVNTDVIVYVRAKVKVNSTDTFTTSAAKPITVKKSRLLLSDECANTEKMNNAAESGLEPKQGAVNRVFAAEDLINYGALGVASTDTSGLKKYSAHYAEYMVYGDLKDYFVDVVLYDENKAAGNNKTPFQYQVEIHTSADGINWTYNKSDYTLLDNIFVPEAIGSATYSAVRFASVNGIPSGTRYIRVYMLGQIGITGMQYYNGLQLSDPDNTGRSLDQITNFYNCFAPFICGVNLFADKSASVEEVVTSVDVRNSVLDIRKGTDYVLDVYKELSTDAGNFVAASANEVSYEVLEGNEYVNVTDGSLTISIKSDFTATALKKLKLKVKIGDAFETVEFRLITPVSSVTVSTKDNASATIQRGTTSAHYLALEAAFAPADATLTTAVWAIVSGPDGHNAEFSGNRFRSNTVGTYTVKATVDGVDSAVFTVKVVEQATLSDNLQNKNVEIGGKLTLTAAIAPDELKGLEINWAIIAGEEFATLAGSELTGVAEGTVKVRGTVKGSSKTIEYDINVTKAGADKTNCGSCGTIGFISGGGIGGILGVMAILGLASFLLIRKNNKKVND